MSLVIFDEPFELLRDLFLLFLRPLTFLSSYLVILFRPLMDASRDLSQSLRNTCLLSLLSLPVFENDVFLSVLLVELGFILGKQIR